MATTARPRGRVALGRLANEALADGTESRWRIR